MSEPNESLEDSEDRFRFLSGLGEATRELADPERVLEVVAERLGSHLRASRCAYAEVEPDADSFTIRHDYTNGCTSATGRYHLSLFGPRAASDQHAGRTLIVCDVDQELEPEEGAITFNAIGIKALVCCPLIRSGRLVAMMAVHQTWPRRWSAHEVALVEAVVERSWAYIERARALRDLAASEARFRQLADAMPQIVWAARPDGVLDYYNRRWFEYIGVAPSDQANAAWDRHVHGGDAERVHRAWARALATGDEYVAEFRLRRADGQFRWFLVRALPIRDEQQELSRWFGTCTDIDDKKRADEAFHRSREQLELVVKSANVGIWYSILPSGELIWDDKMKEHFHLPSDAQIDLQVFYRGLHPEDRERTRLAIETSIMRRVPYEIDYRTVSPDGLHVKWIHASGRVLEDPAGTPARFDGITIDVTQRMQAEIALRESELRFRSMSDNAPVIIWVTHADGHCEYLNRRWYEFTGETSQPSGDFSRLSALHPDDVERAREAFVSANEAQAAFKIEYRLRRKDGAYRWCVDAASPRLGPHGEFLGYIGSVIDITDRAVAEQERAALLESERAARIEAERASRMKDEFLATLSHELRTPLNAVLGWAQMLKPRTSRPEELEKGLAVIARNARAQNQIIEDLLDMSRIVSGKVRLDVQHVGVAGLVRSTLETVKPAADAKGIRLVTNVDQLPELFIRGDGNRLHQVLWNLLSNAVKFTPRGGRVEVRIEWLEGAQLDISVTDSGEGIAAEFLPYVFDRFRQADASTTRRHGGLGLGLAIVKQLVELHGGAIAVKSAGQNQGATFRIALPLPPAQPALTDRDQIGARRTASGRELVTPGAVDLRGLTVLVVDDEADARALVERILVEGAARVTTAASADEAWQLLSAGTFDLLISDIGMPQQDGYSLIRHVRAQERAYQSIPAIALTAYARDEDRLRALREGYQIHLVKPVEPAELLSVVASLAGDKRRLDHAR
ncbi:MAG TPA: PAS domain-containing protein [Polyangiaceae bacterium]|nr:PAS domain-containing protein [Polyangiaceae bacterium]